MFGFGPRPCDMCNDPFIFTDKFTHNYSACLQGHMSTDFLYYLVEQLCSYFNHGFWNEVSYNNNKQREPEDRTSSSQGQ